MLINQHRLEFENQLKVSSIYVLTYTYETLEYHILWFLEYILKIQLSFISLSNSRTHRNIKDMQLHIVLAIHCTNVHKFKAI